MNNEMNTNPDTRPRGPNCPHCHWIGGGDVALHGPQHAKDCPDIDLESARWYLACHVASEKASCARVLKFVVEAQKWEGKFRIVCHENNVLRRKLNSFNVNEGRRYQIYEPPCQTPTQHPDEMSTSSTIEQIALSASLGGMRGEDLDIIEAAIRSDLAASPEIAAILACLNDDDQVSQTPEAAVRKVEALVAVKLLTED